MLAYLMVLAGVTGHASSEFFAVLSGASSRAQRSSSGCSGASWVQPLTLFDKEPIAAWSLLTLGLWNTTITQVLWFGGLAAVPDITRGSYLFFLKPVITAFLALAILSQPISAMQILAITVICSAVLIEIFWPNIVRTFKTA